MARPSPEKLRAWRALLTTHARLIPVLAAELDEAHRLPLTWYDVLLNLHEQGGVLRMHELADFLLLSRSATTRFVDRIEAAGLVERRACDGDGRGTDVVLTRRGEQELRAAAPTHLDGIEAHFGAMIDETEAAVISDALQRVLDAGSP